MDFGLATFKETPRGQMVASVITSTDCLTDMRVLSKYGFPAAMALGKPLLSLAQDWTHTEKKLVGRWIKEELAKIGLKVDKKSKRVPPGYLFTVAATYS